MMAPDILFIFVISVGTAVATIILLFRMIRERLGGESYTMRDSLNTMQRITNALSEISSLPVRERVAKRRMIARDILRDLAFVFSLVDECFRDDHPGLREQTLALAREIIKLRWELKKNLFLSCFRPKLLADCLRILDAACRHCGIWVTYLQLMKTKYPNQFCIN